jgi:hypothetical protein
MKEGKEGEERGGEGKRAKERRGEERRKERMNEKLYSPVNFPVHPFL